MVSLSAAIAAEAFFEITLFGGRPNEDLARFSKFVVYGFFLSGLVAFVKCAIDEIKASQEQKTPT